MHQSVDEKSLKANTWICVSIASQTLTVFAHDVMQHQFTISTAKAGVGQESGSYQTPLGWHNIRAKIGKNAPENTVFVGRRQTGEQYSPDLSAAYPGRDWILTRILWLSGLERAKNRLHTVDTMRRYIYIHGSPESRIMGVPSSKGCICMRNIDIVKLFDIIPVRTPILIKESR